MDSAAVDKTTIVSVRVTPSIRRRELISRSSDGVFRVLTLRSSVCPPVTWWHSSTSGRSESWARKASMSFG